MLHPTAGVATRQLRNKITQRMQQITQCVTSQGFISALQEALANPQTAQYVLGARNLRSLGVPIPSGATIIAIGPPCFGGFQINLQVNTLLFRCIYPSQFVQSGDPLAQLHPLQNTISQRMQEFTRCVTSQGFASALQQVVSDYRTHATDPYFGQEVGSILGIVNLQALGVPIPSGFVDVAFQPSWPSPFRVGLIHAPISIYFDYSS